MPIDTIVQWNDLRPSVQIESGEDGRAVCAPPLVPPHGNENVIRLPFADGKTALIAGADVGVAAAAVLANPEPHIGKVYELTGAQSQTMAQYAEEFSRALGRTIQYVDVPPHIWEAKLHEAQLPAHLIAHLVTMGQLHRDNRYDRMTDSFHQLVGRPPVAAAEFARRLAAAFTPGGSSLVHTVAEAG